MLHKRKFYAADKALAAMQKYCALQDRCQQDIRRKLLDGGIYGDDLENIIAELISDGFLDESRYAKALVSGKYKINLWGRNKIKILLKSKEISSYCIKEGLSVIDENIYLSNAAKLLEKKLRSIPTDDNAFTRKQKAFKYLMDKGYESYIFKTLWSEVCED